MEQTEHYHQIIPSGHHYEKAYLALVIAVVVNVDWFVATGGMVGLLVGSITTFFLIATSGLLSEIHTENDINKRQAPHFKEMRDTLDHMGY